LTLWCCCRGWAIAIAGAVVGAATAVLRHVVASSMGLLWLRPWAVGGLELELELLLGLRRRCCGTLLLAQWACWCCSWRGVAMACGRCSAVTRLDGGAVARCRCLCPRTNDCCEAVVPVSLSLLGRCDVALARWQWSMRGVRVRTWCWLFRGSAGDSLADTELGCCWSLFSTAVLCFDTVDRLVEEDDRGRWTAAGGVTRRRLWLLELLLDGGFGLFFDTVDRQADRGRWTAAGVVTRRRLWVVAAGVVTRRRLWLLEFILDGGLGLLLLEL
jgi:hypothetical protein